MQINCHLCKKRVHESEIQFEPVTGDDDIEKVCDTIDKSDQIQKDCGTPPVASNKKKKKSKRDNSAGLILPVSKAIATKSKPSTKQNPTNRNKLKNLLDNQSSSSGKSNLLEFLKKI